MRPPVKFIPATGFTIVLTPHWREQWEKRKHLIATQEIPSTTIYAIWRATPPHQVAGTSIGSAYVYFEKTWNKRRNRWELEFISITPAHHFHTGSRKDAIYVNIDTGRYEA